MPAISWITAAAVLCFACGSAFSEPADSPLPHKAATTRKTKAKPDKNQYWLLNPVPTDQLRSFSTDRPTKSNVPYTVDAGHFQYETDLVNFTHQVVGSRQADTLLVPNPTFKLGVTNNVDFEVNVPFAGVHTFDTATAASSTLWGVGDTFVRSKINLWGNDGGDSAAAVIPYVKAPSAPLGIGDGAVEAGLIGPVAFSLPNNFTLLLVPEIDVLKDTADNGRHGNYILLSQYTNRFRRKYWPYQRDAGDSGVHRPLSTLLIERFAPQAGIPVTCLRSQGRSLRQCAKPPLHRRASFLPRARCCRAPKALACFSEKYQWIGREPAAST
jgi:hypothetical protein